jgi:hypothetical protein
LILNYSFVEKVEELVKFYILRYSTERELNYKDFVVNFKLGTLFSDKKYELHFEIECMSGAVRKTEIVFDEKLLRNYVLFEDVQAQKEVRNTINWQVYRIINNLPNTNIAKELYSK